MGQVFVSFDKGDVFSISFFYGSSLQSRWRVRTTDFTKKLVEVIWKRKGFFVLVLFIF